MNPGLSGFKPGFVFSTKTFHRFIESPSCEGFERSCLKKCKNPFLAFSKLLRLSLREITNKDKKKEDGKEGRKDK